MGTPEHTPGPWVRCGRIIDAETPTVDLRICVVDEGPSESESKANARLIAAAPDLLAACKGLADAIEGHERRTGTKQMHPAVDAARAAIAKAKGGEL